jgi:hypothetical protein
MEAYDLSTAVAPAPVPANFIQIKSISSPQGTASMGGFHIATTPVTQREYEAVMKQNPSLVKNPTQPVNNVSAIDAMMYCNHLSIRDGLEPAYLIEYEGAHRDWLWGIQEERITSVTLDRFASGYRLPTTEEWKYASGRIDQLLIELDDDSAWDRYTFTQISVMGGKAEYIFDGAFEQVEFVSNSAGDRRRATYIGWDSDFTIESELMPLLAGSREYNVGRAVKYYEQDLGEVDTGTFRIAADRTRIPIMGHRVRVAPVIRPIRPVFDYWKYTSGQ